MAYGLQIKLDDGLSRFSSEVDYPFHVKTVNALSGATSGVSVSNVVYRHSGVINGAVSGSSPVILLTFEVNFGPVGTGVILDAISGQLPRMFFKPSSALMAKGYGYFAKCIKIETVGGDRIATFRIVVLLLSAAEYDADLIYLTTAEANNRRGEFTSGAMTFDLLFFAQLSSTYMTTDNFSRFFPADVGSFRMRQDDGLMPMFNGGKGGKHNVLSGSFRPLVAYSTGFVDFNAKDLYLDWVDAGSDGVHLSARDPDEVAFEIGVAFEVLPYVQKVSHTHLGEAINPFPSSSGDFTRYTSLNYSSWEFEHIYSVFVHLVPGLTEVHAFTPADRLSRVGGHDMRQAFKPTQERYIPHLGMVATVDSAIYI